MLVQPRTTWWIFQLYSDETHAQVKDLYIVEASSDDEAFQKGCALAEQTYGLIFAKAKHLAAKFFHGRVATFTTAFFSVKEFDLHELLAIVMYSENWTSHLTLAQKHDFANHIRKLVTLPVTPEQLP